MDREAIRRAVKQLVEQQAAEWLLSWPEYRPEPLDLYLWFVHQSRN